MSPAIDLDVDGHVHTGFATGHGAIGEFVIAAEQVGLHAITFGDLAGPDTTWLSAYEDAVRRAQRRTDVILRTAIEVEIDRYDGWLAFPGDLAGLETVSVCLADLPLPEGRLTAEQVRSRLRDGSLSPTVAIDVAVDVTVRALERASRYAPTQLGRPLSLLGAAGVEQSQVSDAQLRHLVAGCAATRTVVEVSEAWRAPTPRMARLLHEAGVPLLAASDGTETAQVGQWRYVRDVLADLESGSG